MSEAVWIKTEPSVDGTTYVATVEFTGDRAIILTPDTATRYAMTILAAVARAEYDAAVYTQMTNTLNLDTKHAAQVINDLRNDRPDIDTTATAPMEIRPGVNADGKPFLIVLVDNKPVGQWEPDDAREHALVALEVCAVADLDAGYYRTLTGSVGVDEPTARNVIEALAEHR